MFLVVLFSVLVLVTCKLAPKAVDPFEKAMNQFDEARTGIMYYVVEKNSTYLDILDRYENAQSFSVYTCSAEEQGSVPKNLALCKDRILQELGKGCFKRGIEKFVEQYQFTNSGRPRNYDENTEGTQTFIKHFGALWLDGKGLKGEKKIWYCQMSIQYSLPKEDNFIVDLFCN